MYKLLFWFGFFDLTYGYFMMDEACSPGLHFLISQNVFTVHPANFIQECNLSANSVNIKIWVLFIWADREAELSEAFARENKIYTVLWAAVSLIQFANSVVLISALKLQVSIRVSRDIISALSVFSIVAG